MGEGKTIMAKGFIYLSQDYDIVRFVLREHYSITGRKRWERVSLEVAEV